MSSGFWSSIGAELSKLYTRLVNQKSEARSFFRFLFLFFFCDFFSLQREKKFAFVFQTKNLKKCQSVLHTKVVE